MAFAFGLGPDAAMVIELLAFADQAFRVEQGQTARVGAGALSNWLAGVWTGAAGQLAARDSNPRPPSFRADDGGGVGAGEAAAA